MVLSILNKSRNIKSISQLIILVVLISLSIAPAWAGQGWYLIEPEDMRSSSDNGAVIYLIQHLEFWNQIGAFETAKDCEDKRLKMKADLLLMNQKKRPDNDPEFTSNLNRWNWQERYRRCIASDDPRLK